MNSCLAAMMRSCLAHLAYVIRLCSTTPNIATTLSKCQIQIAIVILSFEDFKPAPGPIYVDFIYVY